MLRLTKDLEVFVSSYKGPFQLLYELVCRQEIPVQELSIKELILFFLCYEEWILDKGGFSWSECSPRLLLCASLLYKKSCAMLEVSDAKEEEVLYENIEDDFQAYREYLDFKELADKLDVFYESNSDTLSAFVPAVDPECKYTQPDQFSADHLAKIFDDLMLSFEGVDEEIIPEEEHRVSDKIEWIESVLTKRPMSLKALIFNAKTRIECIVIFLALLELLKQAGVTIQMQNNEYIVSKGS